jgi:hypothetical protein
MARAHLTAGGRYPVLRTIAILWLVGAVLALIGGVYQAIAAVADLPHADVLSRGDTGGRWTTFVIWLAATFFAVIVNVAIAELIKLAMDIEHNTRMMTPGGTAAATGSPAGRLSNGVEDESAEIALIRGH